MGKRTRSRMAMPFLVLALLVGLAGCGDDDEDETAGGQPATTVTSAPATTASAAATTTTQAAALLRTANNDRLGTILVDASGKTLYTFDRDTGPTSACTGNCAVTWPPLMLPAGVSTPSAPGVSGTLAASPRPDGNGSQVTLNGKPLYLYSGDSSAGDVNGDGVGGVWHVAKPA